MRFKKNLPQHNLRRIIIFENFVTQTVGNESNTEKGYGFLLVCVSGDSYTFIQELFTVVAQIQTCLQS